MEAFPEDYLVHNLPLIVLYGLDESDKGSSQEEKGRTLLQEGGFRVKTDLPPVNNKVAAQLLDALRQHDATNAPWSARHAALAENRYACQMRNAGRTYTLPPRKAPPPPHSPWMRPANDSITPPPAMVLHSVISPLSSGSPLYPDGIMTSLWIAKHQFWLPSIFITFFYLTADTSTSVSQDNRLKAEINNIRGVFSSTNYKTKLVVILVGDGVISTPNAEERVGNIRRSTSLDTRSLFYLSAASPAEAVADFAESTLSILFPVAIEYYRDLSKHARRKRNRSTVPQPTVQPTMGTSQVLSSPGWNVRYEFKLGVLAEFRQEMDAATRNYEAAYETLFSAELFEAIPSWSPRFNEARLLADIITIRVIRCLLWTGQTTNAVKAWENHRCRVRDIIDRRGAGTNTYAWEAWQAIWSKTMADLIGRTQVFPPPNTAGAEPTLLTVQIHSEKTLQTTERFTPWESLHHQGYWLDLAQKFTQARRLRALQIPEEDRASPGQSPASTIASKVHLYDRYLVPEPHREYPVDGQGGYTYQQEIIDTLETATKHFTAHSQTRKTKILQMKQVLELIRSSSLEEAISLLNLLWEDDSLRTSGWWMLLNEIGKALSFCARETRNFEVAIQVDWELAHTVIASGTQLQDLQGMPSDIANSGTLPRVALSTQTSVSRIVPHFSFATDEGHVGKPIVMQLCLRHIETSDRKTLKVAQVKVVFEGNLKPIYLMNNPDGEASDGQDGVQISHLQLADVGLSDQPENKRSSIGTVSGSSAVANLLIGSGQVRVLQLELSPHEAGEVSVASVTLQLDDDGYDMTITTSRPDLDHSRWWEMRNGVPVSRSHGRGRDAATIKILPKPPRIDIETPHLRDLYYTNEEIQVTVEISNHEDEIIEGHVEARLISASKTSSSLRWHRPDGPTSIPGSEAAGFVQNLPRLPLAQIEAGKRASLLIHMVKTEDAVDHELEITVTYTLPSSPQTLLTKLLIVDVSVSRPFEANFGFYSRRHSELWPNFFSATSIMQNLSVPAGIKQRYAVSAMVCSFAAQDICINSTVLVNEKVVGDALCAITSSTVKDSMKPSEVDEETSASMVIQPQQTKSFGFDMILQKLVLGDRQPVAVDLLLEVVWKRLDSDKVNTSILQVPRFLVPSSEPRVLLQAAQDEEMSGLYNLDYTIENPSLHFLTFNITMESSEDFAFSGPKSKMVSLVPLSRYDVTYRLLPNKAKEWTIVNLEVVDAYFGQTLKVQPASERIRVNKQGQVLLRFGAT